MPDATENGLTIYYDYTCRYSYRAMHWADLLAAAQPGISIRWRTFSLKEVNRHPEEPSWVVAGARPSLSVLAQALAHAARKAEFPSYHRHVFDAMQGEERHLDEPDFLSIASDAGVDVDAFAKDRDRWIAAVGDEHRHAVEHWGVYGTPTVLLDGAAAYMRLREEPGTEPEAVALLDSLHGIARSRADLTEIFRPEGPKPTPIQIERLEDDAPSTGA
jgi:2-hydroxychromene-2-carboxylate isomerase